MRFSPTSRGFIIYARRAGQLPANLDSLDASERNPLLEPFYNATLTFLYRLLFLLYAESRDLLPVREVRGYHEKSLERLKRQVAEKAGTIQDQAPGKLKAAYTDLSTAFYDRLQELFDAVDKGDAALNVPVYNGGLFMTQPDPADTSPEADVARFLAHCKIPDRELALGLDLMARDMDEKRHDLAFIDYKSLGVRQLGSMYEGLLEFKLRVAPEEMAVVKGKKTEEIVPYTEAKQKKLPILKEGRGKDAYDKTYSRGKVYLENDRRERKATGSYYTPDYIVKYIVEHTVGPVITEKLETLRPIFREAEKTLKVERDKVKALGRKDISPENETYKKYRQTLNEAFFDLKVLDPAMGSGHFLVEAVDYITDQMAKILTAFNWSPIVHELAQTRHEIQQEMDRQGVTIDMSKLTDLNLLKRRVLKSCIYGVDLNPMAVELAKVSLWLDCFTLGAPLSFLDHHMKSILDKLKINCIPLGKYAEDKIRRGILTGFNEAFVIDQATRDRLKAEDPKSSEIIKAFLIGDDVRRYSLDYRDRYLIWTYIGVPINKYPAIYNHLQRYQEQLEKRWDKGNYWWELRHCDYYADFEKPKIVYPNIAKEARFTFDDTGMFSNQKTYIIPMSDYYLLAILNARVSFLWILKNCSVFGDAEKGGRAELSYVFMKNLPIRRINFTTSPHERAYYLEKAKNLYEYCLDKNDQVCVLGFVNHHLSQQPEESDVVHDLLAFLAEEMIRLNKEKRAAQHEFLDWLVTTLKILPDKEGCQGIDVLTGKAKLADYPGDYQKNEPSLATEELLDILRKNKNHLDISLSDASLVDRIKKTYEESLQRVMPLKERLARTDKLIDQVVYRLYGLTEEEIGVVEGRG